VTARKREEDDQVVRSKLESTGILAGGLAHDFNNLLTVILLNLEAAKNPGLEPVRTGEHLDAAMAAVFTASELTKQLITFSSGGAPIRQLVDVQPVLKEALDGALRGSTVGGTDLIAPDLWSVEGDRGQIGQVIRNLVLNAREAMPAGGIASLQAENYRVVAGMAAELPPGHYVHVIITDHGMGITREVLPKIFDPYFSTKQRGEQKGMGLGLTICRSIVEHHGGKISVETAPGRGTTVHVYLPATGRMAPAARQIEPAPPPVSTGRILVMDDDDGLRLVLGLTLEMMGFEVTTAADGASAVEYFRGALEAGRPYRLVILDLTVPNGMGGVATLAELRQIDPAVRAVVMSGYSDSAELQEWNKIGFVGALTKPFENRTLENALARALAR
jgi:CheY-like chemotaxis protein